MKSAKLFNQIFKSLQFCCQPVGIVDFGSAKVRQIQDDFLIMVIDAVPEMIFKVAVNGLYLCKCHKIHVNCNKSKNKNNFLTQLVKPTFK